MKDDIEKIYAKLIDLEAEVANLRTGYIVVNQRYADAMGSLKALTASALEAAKRAAIAAEKALLAAKSSAAAAAVAHQAEESSIRASAEAAEATKRAADAAAEAVRMSNLASESARNARKNTKC